MIKKLSGQANNQSDERALGLEMRPGRNHICTMVVLDWLPLRVSQEEKRRAQADSETAAI